MNAFIYALICLFLVHLGNVQGKSEWFGENWLQNNYLFKWKTDDINKTIIIRIEVQSKGWVGFGFSKHGKIQEVDLVIGWVDEMGQTILKASLNLSSYVYISLGTRMNFQT